MSDIEHIGPGLFQIAKTGSMRVPGLVIASSTLMKDIQGDKSLDQVRNVAHLPGIVGYSVAMPDIHWGYGFPIGGVAATDAETGVISPGGVGYDINCGVRLAVVNVPFKSLTDKKKDDLLKTIFQLVPSGVGRGTKNKALTNEDYIKLAALGALWSIQEGYGFDVDLEHTESRGFIEKADMKAVSELAKMRGKNQLGTIGSGNHFVEIGEVQKLFLQDIASEWGVEEGQTYILIHSGSRGFGHQICQDTLDSFIHQGYANNLPDRQLVAAPIASEAGRKYFQAMAAAANFAFNNRQRILHAVRQGFCEVLKIAPQEVRLIYDVCHNIAKFEEHEVEGKLRKLCVHRKGATRAYGPGSHELTPLYQKTGQPVLVPGDMGRASHLMVGLGNPLTFCSSCHGAGRRRSRMQSKKSWQGRNLIEYMASQGIKVMADSQGTIAEEMPDAYKDVDEVVDAVEEAKLAKKVARLKPHLVIKG